MAKTPRIGASLGWLLVAVVALVGLGLRPSWAESTAPGAAVEQRQLSALDVPEQLPEASVDRRPWTRRCAVPLPPDVLACVDGFAIDRAAFDRARAEAPEEVGNRDLVDALIRAEVLAGQALRAGLWGDWLVDPFRAAMMRRLLVQRFERDFGPDKVQDADIERAFVRAPIRVRYAHERHWSVIDAQFLCCTGDWHGCEVDPKVQRCQEANYPQAEALAAELAADPPQSAREFEGRVLAARPRFPNASVQSVGFYYDLSKSYDQQGEYDKMLESWTTAVIGLKVGEISAPIRSAYGWHIVRVNEIAPKITGTTKDPEVRGDIAQGILNGVRERDLMIYVTDLMRSRNVALLYDNVLY